MIGQIIILAIMSAVVFGLAANGFSECWKEFQMAARFRILRMEMKKIFVSLQPKIILYSYKECISQE